MVNRIRIAAVVVAAAASVVGVAGAFEPAGAYQQSGTNGEIAYSSSAGGLQRIWSMHADGSSQRIVLNHDDTVADIDPEWSPDGRQIAFIRISAAPESIWVTNADGSNAHVVFTGTSDVRSPSWSPDGHQIAFSQRSGAGKDVWILTVATGQATNLTNAGAGGYGITDPSWSPDGSRIAYAVANFGVAPSYHAIGIKRADGTQFQDSIPTDATADISSPAWSPDGSRLAWIEDSTNVWTGSVSGLAVSGQVARGISGAGQVTWSPDGQRLLYASASSGHVGLVSASASGTLSTVTLLSNGADNAFASWSNVQPALPPTAQCDGQLATIIGSGTGPIVGTAGNDVIVGTAGNDVVIAGGGKDVVCGGAGNDVIKGNGGDDWLFGEGGNDKLKGGGGKDVCTGGPGRDTAKKCEKVRSLLK